jgi:hypothetical protein
MLKLLKEYHAFPSLRNAYRVWKFHRDSYLAQLAICTVWRTQVYNAALHHVANARMVDLADAMQGV